METQEGREDGGLDRVTRGVREVIDKAEKAIKQARKKGKATVKRRKKAIAKRRTSAQKLAYSGVCSRTRKPTCRSICATASDTCRSEV